MRRPRIVSRDIEKEIADLEEESKILTQNWQAEKEKLGSAQKIKEELDHARTELEQAQRRGDLAKRRRARLRRASPSSRRS